jgi:hypothetical protein
MKKYDWFTTLLWLVVLALVLSVAPYASAGDRTLQWEPVADSDLDHYEIWQAEIDFNSGNSTQWEKVVDLPADTPPNSEGNIELTLTGLDDAVEWVFQAVSVDGAGNKSIMSNIAFDRPDRTAPDQVIELRIRLVQ